MGNKQNHHHTSVIHHNIDLDHPDVIYLPNDIVSGAVSNLKPIKASVLLIGAVHFKKHTKKRLENHEIIFYSAEFPLTSPSTTKQNFQFRLNEQLPPSCNDSTGFPNISYSINLVYKKSPDRFYSSVPIRICPRVQIDQPSLLTPLLFGPIDNQIFHTKLQIKVNRSVFQFGETMQIFYELQNPKEEHIQKIEVSLGIYYLVESDVHQADVLHSVENFNSTVSNQKLIRNKAVLNVSDKVYFPPTFKYKHDQDNKQSLFHLSIDYKIQFKIYLGNSETLWQVDVPIILCNVLVEQTQSDIVDVEQKTESIE